MIAEWLEELSIGNELIDNQKKELFRNINNFLGACRERRGRDEIENFLQFLEKYVSVYLPDEESFLRDHCYPCFREHKEEHDEFTRKLRVLDEQFVKEGATACVMVGVGRLALDWVVDHVYQSDKLVAESVHDTGRQFN